MVGIHGPLLICNSQRGFGPSQSEALRVLHMGRPFSGGFRHVARLSFTR